MCSGIGAKNLTCSVFLDEVIKRVVVVGEFVTNSINCFAHLACAFERVHASDTCTHAGNKEGVQNFFALSVLMIIVDECAFEDCFHCSVDVFRGANIVRVFHSGGDDHARNACVTCGNNERFTNWHFSMKALVDDVLDAALNTESEEVAVGEVDASIHLAVTVGRADARVAAFAEKIAHTV